MILVEVQSLSARLNNQFIPILRKNHNRNHEIPCKLVDLVNKVVSFLKVMEVIQSEVML